MGRYINKKTNSGTLGYRAVRRSRPTGATCNQPRGNALGISKTLCIFYLLQDDGLLILQRSECKSYIAHGIGCKMGATLNYEKKKVP